MAHARMRIDPPSERIEKATREVLDQARRNLIKVFALELDAVGEPRRTQLIDAMHTATTWGAWYHWRMMGMDTAQARAAMESMLRILLETTDSEPSGRQ